MTAVLVAVGAALGGAARYVVAHWLDGRWPTGTLVVNVVGSGLVGLFSALALAEHAWAFAVTGFCGALTTYSSFAVQVVDRPRREGTAYAAVTVLASLGLCALGWWLGSATT